MTKARPILFSTDMVKGILEDRKKQTRRIIKPNPLDLDDLCGKNPTFIGTSGDKAAVECNELQTVIKCKYGKPGDLLWVRETFFKINAPELKGAYYYKASTDEGWKLKWKPSIFMPKNACRLFLEIKDIRVERLNCISEEDAMAEGVDFRFFELFQENRFKDYLDEKDDYRTGYSSFQSLWEKINGLDSWKANPWVWVLEFEKIEKPQGWPW